MFVLVVGSTDISKIPGISAAGASLDVLPYTAPADADMVWWGKPRVVDWLPFDPQGHPSPAIVTRAAVEMAEFPVTLVNAGSFVTPVAPFIEVGGAPSKDPSKETALPLAGELFETGRGLARGLSQGDDPLVIGESVPGGTTTASLVLGALGYNGSVSSAGPENPLPLKKQLRDNSFKRLGIKLGGLSGAGLRAMEELGDPMQPLVAGIAAGAPRHKKIVLAGGTQMLAVAAALRHMGVDRPLTVATTCYVRRDKSADFCSMAKAIGVEGWWAPLDFSRSLWTGLRDYEKGYIKEGAGAGGSVWYANYLGVTVESIITRTEELYSSMIQFDKAKEV